MSDLITVTGVVGSDPRTITTAQGLTITSFRLASRRRYFDRAAGTWQDGETNWYSVSAFRQLGFNAGASLRKGERVIVHGRLKQRQWTAGEKSGLAIEIDAETIGHDLVFGITQLRRLQPPRDGATDAPADSDRAATGEDAGAASIAAPAAHDAEAEHDAVAAHEPGGDAAALPTFDEYDRSGATGEEDDYDDEFEREPAVGTVLAGAS